MASLLPFIIGLYGSARHMLLAGSMPAWKDGLGASTSFYRSPDTGLELAGSIDVTKFARKTAIFAHWPRRPTLSPVRLRMTQFRRWRANALGGWQRQNGSLQCCAICRRWRAPCRERRQSVAVRCLCRRCTEDGRLPVRGRWSRLRQLRIWWRKVTDRWTATSPPSAEFVSETQWP